MMWIELGISDIYMAGWVIWLALGIWIGWHIDTGPGVRYMAYFWKCGRFRNVGRVFQIVLRVKGFPSSGWRGMGNFSAGNVWWKSDETCPEINVL